MRINPVGRIRKALLAISLMAVIGTVAVASAAEAPVYGSELQGFSYSEPVQQFSLTSQGAAMHMAYLDVKPENPNG